MVMTPFANADENTPEARYNACHMSTRSCVERCIRVLKGRFLCIKERVLKYDLVKVAFIVNACAVLHNFALRVRLPLPPLYFDGHDLENMKGVVLAESLLGARKSARNLREEGSLVCNILVARHFQVADAQ
ncbi:hypothetical protein PR048_023152 [Dryococelus australis]|uniref:DDE Tnp4 domain-containing protein n=1 Tax=Dryococelus australis TaxID=614101 RepID=A0ABQ9GTB2_9NEOP|nr:hypothetical protein PR048_023152 [Dryococelus australis]